MKVWSGINKTRFNLVLWFESGIYTVLYTWWDAAICCFVLTHIGVSQVPLLRRCIDECRAKPHAILFQTT